VATLYSPTSTHTADLSSYLLCAIPLGVAAVLVRHLASAFWSPAPDAPHLRWRGYVMSCALWPVTTLAFICALLRVRVPHIATPKEHSGGTHLSLIVPQVVLSAALVVGVATHPPHSWSGPEGLIAAFAILLTAIQGAAVYAAVRS